MTDQFLPGFTRLSVGWVFGAASATAGGYVETAAADANDAGNSKYRLKASLLMFIVHLLI